MKKFIAIIFFAILLSGCEPEAVLKGRHVYKEYYKKHLKDPDSFKVYEEKYEILDDGSVQWTLDYGAKNGWGAMDRETVTFKTTSTLFVKGREIWDMKGR